MATAKLVVPQEPYVQLMLSKDESETLLCILDAIGGDSITSSRRYTDSIAYSLRSVGIRRSPSLTDRDCRSRSDAMVGSISLNDRIR